MRNWKAERVLTLLLEVSQPLSQASDSSGAVIKLLLRFCTMMLANSRSSSFSIQSARVL